MYGRKKFILGTGETSMEYKNLLSVIAEQYKQILNENLVGIYVHGSIAFGCFNRYRSDIDFIVVINNPISKQIKLQLLQVLLNLSDKAPPNNFEMSVVLKKYCQKFIYPTPYELHYSDGYFERHSKNPLLLCYDAPQYDPDLAAHFTVIVNTGIVLCGEPISEIFGDIPKEHYLDSIRKDIENAKENALDYPVYYVLNLCRVYAYMKDGLVLSKEKGGQWGMANLPEKYHSLIDAALGNYVKDTIFCKDEALQIDFCEYMLNLIFNPTVPAFSSANNF